MLVLRKTDGIGFFVGMSFLYRRQGVARRVSEIKTANRWRDASN